MRKSEVLQKLYKDKSYSCEVPPVYSGNWNEEDWINWVLKTGKFNFEKDGKTWIVDKITENEAKFLTPDGQIDEVLITKLVCYRYTKDMRVWKDFDITEVFETVL